LDGRAGDRGRAYHQCHRRSRIDLLEALDKLERINPQLVAPVVLRDLSQLTYPEIAELLGLPLSTVKMRIHEGRKLMRKYMG
jgi:RNA polymerase sigma-70 factor (ECF subfamily)